MQYHENIFALYANIMENVLISVNDVWTLMLKLREATDLWTFYVVVEGSDVVVRSINFR